MSYLASKPEQSQHQGIVTNRITVCETHSRNSILGKPTYINLFVLKEKTKYHLTKEYSPQTFVKKALRHQIPVVKKELPIDKFLYLRVFYGISVWSICQFRTLFGKNKVPRFLISKRIIYSMFAFTLPIFKCNFN